LDSSLRKRLSLSILGAISIIDILLSFQLLTETIEKFQQVFATLILIATLLAYIVLFTNRNLIRESFDISNLSGWLIICITFTFLFIVTSFVPENSSSLLPTIVDTLLLITIILNSITVFFVFNAIIDVRLKRWGVTQQEKQLENYLENKSRIKGRSSFSIDFESITRKLVGPSAQTRPCPHCLSAIDFNETIEWLGPTALACNQCGKVVNIDDLLDGL
jgi:hypothetical protein